MREPSGRNVRDHPRRQRPQKTAGTYPRDTCDTCTYIPPRQNIAPYEAYLHRTSPSNTERKSAKALRTASTRPPEGCPENESQRQPTRDAAQRGKLYATRSIKSKPMKDPSDKDKHPLPPTSTHERASLPFVMVPRHDSKEKKTCRPLLDRCL